MKKLIDFNDWHRSKHFQAFSSMSDPHFAVTFPVDVKSLIKGPDFFSRFLYLIHQTCSEIPEFHYRITDAGEVFYHESLDISFNILARDGLFSNHRVKTIGDYPKFREEVEEAIKEKSQRGVVEIDPDQSQDLLVTSYLPWFAFTSLKEPIINKNDSIPRITWGKYNSEGILSISIQVHHGLMDGAHLGLFYEKLNENIQCCSRIRSTCVIK